MEDEKVKNVISIIKNMNLKNKLRLGLCISSSSYTNLNYIYIVYLINSIE